MTSFECSYKKWAFQGILGRIFHQLNLFLFLYTESPSPYTTGCDVTLTVTATKQYFATEGYPYNYKNNQDCHFNFEAPFGRIVVSFVDFFLEDGFDFLHFRKLHNFEKKH